MTKGTLNQWLPLSLLIDPLVKTVNSWGLLKYLKEKRNYLEKVSGDPELMRGVRENPRATTFATAYLMADFVPTSFFAVAATVAIKVYQKKGVTEESE